MDKALIVKTVDLPEALQTNDESKEYFGFFHREYQRNADDKYYQGEVCSECEGSGQKRWHDTNDSGNYVGTCRTCRGTGRKPIGKEDCPNYTDGGNCLLRSQHGNDYPCDTNYSNCYLKRRLLSFDKMRGRILYEICLPCVHNGSGCRMGHEKDGGEYCVLAHKAANEILSELPQEKSRERLIREIFEELMLPCSEHLGDLMDGVLSKRECPECFKAIAAKYLSEPSLEVDKSLVSLGDVSVVHDWLEKNKESIEIAVELDIRSAWWLSKDRPNKTQMDLEGKVGPELESAWRERFSEAIKSMGLDIVFVIHGI